jgi:hypothetical protein
MKMRLYISLARTLKKDGEGTANRRLFVTVVDPRFDYLPGARCLEDLALLRRTASPLRKAKPRSIAAGGRDLPHCHHSHVQGKLQYQAGFGP